MQNPYKITEQEDGFVFETDFGLSYKLTFLKHNAFDDLGFSSYEFGFYPILFDRWYKKYTSNAFVKLNRKIFDTENDMIYYFGVVLTKILFNPQLLNLLLRQKKLFIISSSGGLPEFFLMSQIRKFLFNESFLRSFLNKFCN